MYQISLDDRPVHQLLQLQIGQVVAHHHLQHSEQLSVSYVAVLIDIVDLEGEPQLVFLVSAIQGGES